LSNVEHHGTSTISLQRLCKDGRNEEMFVFAIVKNFASNPQTQDMLLSSKYQEFQEVFDKVNVVDTLLDHRHYDCNMYL
jgi:hypothetical protein